LARESSLTVTKHQVNGLLEDGGRRRVRECSLRDFVKSCRPLAEIIHSGG